MISPLIRHALPEDAAELNDLEELARLGIREARGGKRLLELVPPRQGNWFTSGLVVLVAVIEDLPVGYLVMNPGDIAVIEAVFVHAQAREVGCGDALLEAAREIAQSAGSRRLEAIALPGDRETKNLYERAAITAKAITVSVDLSSPSNSERVSQ